MSKRKKIILSAIMTILIPAAFIAGYWTRSAGFDIDDIWSSEKNSVESSTEDEMPMTDPYLKEEAIL